MKVDVKVSDEKVLAGLKASRSEINKGVRTGLKAGAERHGLPIARRLAPGHRIRDALTAGATTRTAYLQVSLRKAPEAGLLEFGGTVREPIFPKLRGGALHTPWGPRAAVYKPRHYKGRHYLERAVKQSLPAVLVEAQEAITREIGRHLEVS